MLAAQKTPQAKCYVDSWREEVGLDFLCKRLIPGMQNLFSQKKEAHFRLRFLTYEHS